MPISNEQIEGYLIDTDLPFERVKDGFWIIHDELDAIENIIVVHNAPVITFRVKLMELPQDEQYALLQHLLRLNATSMVAGAYALEENSVVIVDSLQSENLDYNEFAASIESIAFAVREHYEELRGYFGEQKPN